MEALAKSVMSLVGGNPGLSAFLFLLTFGYWTPIPEELALLAIGFALQAAGLSYPAALALSLLALAISDSGCYCFARFLGPKLVKLKPLARVFSPERMRAAELAFARKGPMYIFASRFFVGLRSAAALGSGFLRLPYFRFLLPSLSALAVGGPLWLALGYFAGPRLGGMFESAGKWLSAAGILAALVIAIVVAGRVAGRKLRAEAGEA